MENRGMSIDEFLASRNDFNYKTKDTTEAISIIRYLDGKPCTYYVVKDREGWMFMVNCAVTDSVQIANFLKTKEEVTE